MTGIITDTRAVSALLHANGALAFWDFAAAAPYVEIDMGSETSDDYYDAIFVSPHKLIGGPGTPGLLVARRELFTNRVPDVPGGGTVAYVNPTEHDYLSDVEHREEGGTPAIIGAIRAGLVFQLKEAVGVDTIRRREERFVRAAIERWEANPNLLVLGSHTAERLSIVSFVVRHDGPELPGPSEQGFLHHNYVVALLNDLFGIQSRGGCSCAGPYGHRLLGIDLDRSHEFEREINRGCEGIKPGWIRINFNYFIDDATFTYLLDAVDFVADHGAELLADYRFEPHSGLWHHRRPREAPMSLHDIAYDGSGLHHPDHRQRLGSVPLTSFVDQAAAIVAAAPGTGRHRWHHRTPRPTSSTSAGSPTPARGRSARRRLQPLLEPAVVTPNTALHQSGQQWAEEPHGCRRVTPDLGRDPASVTANGLDGPGHVDRHGSSRRDDADPSALLQFDDLERRDDAAAEEAGLLVIGRTDPEWRLARPDTTTLPLLPVGVVGHVGHVVEDLAGRSIDLDTGGHGHGHLVHSWSVAGRGRAIGSGSGTGSGRGGDGAGQVGGQAGGQLVDRATERFVGIGQECPEGTEHDPPDPPADRLGVDAGGRGHQLGKESLGHGLEVGLDPLGHERCRIQVDRTDQPRSAAPPEPQLGRGLQVRPHQRIHDHRRRQRGRGRGRGRGRTSSSGPGCPGPGGPGLVEELESTSVERGQDPIEDRGGQGWTPAEVVMNGPRIGPGAPHDGPERRPLESVGGEEVLGRIDEGCRRRRRC